MFKFDDYFLAATLRRYEKFVTDSVFPSRKVVDGTKNYNEYRLNIRFLLE
jgi:hypothetical protein